MSPDDHDVDVDVDLTALVAPHPPHLTRSLPGTGLPSEPSAAFFPHVSDVVPINVVKRALEMSPGPKSPSAVHTQKRSKDASIVPGKKLDSEYISSQNSESLRRLSCNRASTPSSALVLLAARAHL